MANTYSPDPYKSLAETSVSGTVYSEVTDISGYKSVGITVEYTNNTGLGYLEVQISNTGNKYQPYELDGVPVISGTDGEHNLNISDLNFEYIRLKAVQTSGTCDIEAWIKLKRFN